MHKILDPEPETMFSKKTSQAVESNHHANEKNLSQMIQNISCASLPQNALLHHTSALLNAQNPMTPVNMTKISDEVKEEANDELQDSPKFNMDLVEEVALGQTMNWSKTSSNNVQAALKASAKMVKEITAVDGSRAEEQASLVFML